MFMVDHVDIYLVIAAARRLSDIYVSLTAGAEHRGMRPGAEDTIRQQLPHIRGVYEIFKTHSSLRLPAIENMIDDLG